LVKADAGILLRQAAFGAVFPKAFRRCPALFGAARDDIAPGAGAFNGVCVLTGSGSAPNPTYT